MRSGLAQAIEHHGVLIGTQPKQNAAHNLGRVADDVPRQPGQANQPVPGDKKPVHNAELGQGRSDRRFLHSQFKPKFVI